MDYNKGGISITGMQGVSAGDISVCQGGNCNDVTTGNPVSVDGNGNKTDAGKQAD